MGEKNIDQETGRKGKGRHVCPWWLAYTFDNPLRQRIHPPEVLLAPYVRPSMCVLDIGCGLGHFSLGMARMVGGGGKVVAVDVQAPALRILERRARRQGLAGRIKTVLSGGDALCLGERCGFALCCNMLHETPDPTGVLSSVYRLLEPGGVFLLMEPSGHVKKAHFEDEVELALMAGFTELERPDIRRELSVAFQK